MEKKGPRDEYPEYAEYDDYMNTNTNTTNVADIAMNEDIPNTDVKPNNHSSFIEPAKQETVVIFEEIPPSVMNNIKQVEFPPTKQTRFTFSNSNHTKELEEQIRKVVPCARLEFKPNKADVPDMMIYEGNLERKKDDCDIPTRHIGSVNFIHQDRQKNGPSSTNLLPAKKYVKVMFFNFENKNEYERIKPVVVDFFKKMDTTTPTNTNTVHNYKKNRDIVMTNQYMGGKRRTRVKKTQKKKIRTKSVSAKRRMKSKRRSNRK